MILERKFQIYYNAARRHASLEGDTPLAFASGHTLVPADLKHVRWVCHCRTSSSSQLPPDSELETDRMFADADDEDIVIDALTRCCAHLR